MYNFINSFLPAPRQGGFAMPGYWVWCGSVIKGEDGRYHMFAARWPQSTPFTPGWLFYSEVVRASSDTYTGPFRFEEVVLQARGRKYFDGMATHNPVIRKHGGKYLLYYMGTSYDFTPDETDKHEGERFWEAWYNKRIGLAVSDSVFGPWRRPDAPLFEPRKDKWDFYGNTNPAPWIMDDGKVYMFYKSLTRDRHLNIGLATADNFAGPYQRADHQLRLDRSQEHTDIEDPFLWYQDGSFHMLAKDITGNICGEQYAGIYAFSRDCVSWETSRQPKAYSKTVAWDDGDITVQGALERPQLLIEDGRPTCMYAATSRGKTGFWNAEASWNMAIPIDGKKLCGEKKWSKPRTVKSSQYEMLPVK